MRIAIVGAGVAGSFLACLFNNKGYEVEVFEQFSKDMHFPVCAWGTSKHMLTHFCNMVGLDFNEYILHVGKRLDIYIQGSDKHEYLNLKGLVTYDKRRWENDMLKGVKINYGVRCTRDNFPLHKYDYVLDCTGFHRSMLPKPNEDLAIPVWEYMLGNLSKERDFYVIGYRRAMGYFWHFPLGNGKAFVGSGHFKKDYYGIKEFLAEEPNAQILMRIGRPVRLAPVTRVEPIVYKNVIGVGESIGTVFPLLGEGITPSLQSAEILYRLLTEGEFSEESYRHELHRKLGYYDDVYKVLRLKMEERFSMLRHSRLLYRIYKHMKREEDRYGFEVSMDKFVNLINAI